MKQNNKITSIHINPSEINEESLNRFFYKKLADAIKDPELDRLFTDMPSDEAWADHITTLRYNYNTQ